MSGEQMAAFSTLGMCLPIYSRQAGIFLYVRDEIIPAKV